MSRPSQASRKKVDKIMLHPFIEKLNEKHLCSWYVLPFMDLNVSSFGYTNFINSYQIRCTYLIAVEVEDIYQCMQVQYSIHFVKMAKAGAKQYFVFRIPEFWIEDYELFLEGKYSKMSDDAKWKIREVCGLKYEVPDEAGNKITDAIIMALENHPVLRSKWSELIGISEQLIPEELLSPPAENSFIDL